MNSITSRLFHFVHGFRHNPCLFVQIQKKLCYALVLFLMMGLSSCFLHYYKTNTSNETDSATLQKLVNEKKYFILHAANQQNFALNNAGINNDNLEGDLNSLPAPHLKYLNPRKETGNRVSVNKKEIVRYEVHLYTNDSMTNMHVRLPVPHFYRIDVYELDKDATNGSTVLSIAGIALGAGAIIAAVISAGNSVKNINYTPTTTQGSNSTGTCSPQVYSIDRNNSDLTGILFSGAVFAPLQRTDYMPLPDVQPGTDSIHLQIRPGENEELYIREAKLLQVTHRTEDKVLIDGNGTVLAYRKPVAPQKAFTASFQDVRSDVVTSDKKYYSFTNTEPGENSSHIILDFKKPAGARSGKLVLRARNAAWGLHIFKKFKSLYGDYYPAMLAQKDKANPKNVLQCELDQSLPLKVSIKQHETWKPSRYFFTPGNIADRDMIMQLDLADIQEADHVTIKLETAFMFWELDCAGMDFSENLPVKTNYLAAGAMLKTGDLPQCYESDQNNIVLNDKEQLDLRFNLVRSTTPHQTNSYFLVGSGYYHDNTKFEGKPQLGILATFSQKGGFDKYSRQTFEELLASFKTNTAKNLVLKE